MSQGEGGGRPRKHPHDPAVGQYAIDAEWQEIADGKSEAIVQRQGYTPYRIATLIDNGGGVNRFTAIIMAIQEIAKDSNLEDIDSLYNCFHNYLDFCCQHNVMVTNMSAYMACGVSKQTISAWSLGQRRAANHPEYKQFAEYVQQTCAANREQLAVEGKINPIVAIFHQKVHDGFDDHPSSSLFLADDDKEELTASEIAEKYAGIGDD